MRDGEGERGALVFAETSLLENESNNSLIHFARVYAFHISVPVVHYIPPDI